MEWSFKMKELYAHYKCKFFFNNSIFSIHSLASQQTDLKEYEKKCTEFITENFYSQDKGADLTLKLLQKPFDKKY